MNIKPSFFIPVLCAFFLSYAHAQTPQNTQNNWYVSLYGTVSSLPSSNLTETRDSSGLLTGKAKFDAGRGFGGALGRNFEQEKYAVEVAWDYQSSGLDAVGSTKADGDYASNSFWFNGYRRLQSSSAWTPYVGAGLGFVQEIDIDIHRLGQELEYSRKGGLAVQGILGVKRQLTSNWALMADARYMHSFSRPKRASEPTGGALSTVPKYNPFSLNFGVVYSF